MPKGKTTTKTETVKAVGQLFSEFGGVSDLQKALELSLPIEEGVPDIINQMQGSAKLSGAVVES